AGVSMTYPSETITIGSENLKNMALDEVRLPRFIRTIEQRFTGEAPTGSDRPYNDRLMLGRIARRRAMFHCLESEDPKLPPPFDLGPKYQTDVPRKVHGELLARLCENGFQVKGRLARDSAVARQKIDAAEEVF